MNLRKNNKTSSYIQNICVSLERYGEFIGIPIKLGRPKKSNQILKSPLSEAEITIIIEATKNIREKSILSLLAYSGIRNQELCSLRIRNLNLAQQSVFVENGKGHKSRLVFISGNCCELLQKYLHTTRIDISPDELLFLTLRNNLPLEPQDLRKIIKTVAKRTKITKRIHPHLFRHSLATNMLNRGANLMTIKEQLGHKYIETTMIYIHSTQQRVQAEYRMFTPSYM
jgi:site-specific recombinase XerD